MGLVFCARQNECDLSEADLSFLPPAETAYIQRCLAPAERARRLAARLVLKSALDHFFAITELPLERDLDNRLFLGTPAAPDFNLSHSGEFILGSFCTSGRTGIDIEQTARVSLRLLDRYLHEREKTDLEKLAESDREKRLTALWTCKEAYAKALGKGLRLSFSRIAFDFFRDEAPELIRAAAEDEQSWTFRTFGGKTYRAAVCLPRGAMIRFYSLQGGRWEENLDLP